MNYNVMAILVVILLMMNTIEEEKNDPTDPARGSHEHGSGSRKEATKENGVSQGVATLHERQRVHTTNAPPTGTRSYHFEWRSCKKWKCTNSQKI